MNDLSAAAQQGTLNQLDLKNATDMTCEKCDGKLFEKVCRIKKVSALVSPTGQEIVLPFELFACKSCGEIPKIFLKELNQ